MVVGNMGRKFLGLHLAPFNVPLCRRLQTAAALTTSYMFLFGGGTAFIFFLCLLRTKFYWITLLYVTWYWFDRDSSAQGGHRLQWLRRVRYFEYLRDFFPISLVKTADLDPTQNYVIGYHPHGVMGMGTTNFVSEATGFSLKFPGIRPYTLTHKLLHYMPLYREYISALGACDVSKASIDHIFSTPGNAAVILIGGAKESLDTNSRMASLVLKSRKGFVKMALKHGAHLVPSFTFGENDLFRVYPDNERGSKSRNVQRYLQKITGYAPIIVHGRGVFNYTFGIVPHRVPVVTVVGKPIILEKDSSPSAEKICALHERYTHELRELFEEHKGQYGYEKQSIEFID